jgi:hypothetical protein
LEAAAKHLSTFRPKARPRHDGPGPDLKFRSIRGGPLLFKGGDFGLTDVMAHPASIRA